MNFIGPTRLMLAVCALLPRTAVTVALRLLGMVAAAAALKGAVVAPAVTVTEAGTVSEVLLLVSVTAEPTAGAGWVRVTVQVLTPLGPRLVGLQDRAETSVGATKVRVVVRKLPFKAAVMVALWFVGKSPALTMKLAKVAPAGTVTDAGIVSSALLSDNVTVAPEDAGSFKPTVQVVEAPEATVPGLQLKDVKLSGTVVTVPPVAVVAIAFPPIEALRAFVTLIVVAADTVTVTTATTPFSMTFVFRPLEVRPVRKQM
jgi:hypothetical protein